MLLAVLPSWLALVLRLALSFTSPFLDDGDELERFAAAMDADLMPWGRAPDEVGLASTYGRARDSGAQAHLACAPDHRIDADDHVCAHRRPLPCGTILLVENADTSASTFCRVMDRGPFGKHDAAGRWFNGARERRRAGTWVGILDLAPAVRAEIGPGDGGKLEVNVWVIYRPARPIKVPRPTS